MKFEIDFTRETNNEVVNIRDRGVGLEGLRFLREKFGNWVEPKDINPYISSLVRNTIEVEINEETATKSGLFEKCNVAKVIITKGNLANYFRIVNQEQEGNTYNTYRYGIKWGICEEEVIEDWENSGYPTEWDISMEE